MEIELNKLKEIAVEYFDIDEEEKLQNDWKEFMYCYDIIKNCPCVKAKDTESLIDCLYLVASDIASNDFFRTTKDNYGNKFYNYLEKHKSQEYIISDALYRIYDEEAISNLSNEYRNLKKLKVKQESNL